jgi:choline dehydrogenase-like flavoprotein
MDTIYQCIRSNNSSIFLDGKPNITLMSKTQAKKLLIEGRSVTGVAVVGCHGEEITVKVKKQVIDSCGVSESSKLLMMSDIGPKAEIA